LQPELSPYFEAYQQHLGSEYAAILQANSDFYRSVAEGDAGLLASLWHPSSDSLCLMAGQEDVITGYRNILAEWSLLMGPSPSKTVELTQLKLHYQGDLATVTFVAQTTVNNPKNKQFSSSSTAYVTNVFVRPSDTDRFLLSAHIASNFAPQSTKAMRALRKTYQDPSASVAKASSSSETSTLDIPDFNSLIKSGMIHQISSNDEGVKGGRIIVLKNSNISCFFLELFIF
jgi:ketosteroid isomerase-like protein